MTEATCPPVTAALGTTVVAPLTITTIAAHQITPVQSAGMGLYGFGLLGGVLVFAIPGSRRRKLPFALLLVCCIALIASCGGGGAPVPQIDPGTPAGTYNVNVTATSSGITRTASFNVIVQ